jgi:hypothetical protein
MKLLFLEITKLFTLNYKNQALVQRISSSLINDEIKLNQRTQLSLKGST